MKGKRERERERDQVGADVAGHKGCRAGGQTSTSGVVKRQHHHVVEAGQLQESCPPVTEFESDQNWGGDQTHNVSHKTHKSLGEDP